MSVTASDMRESRPRNLLEYPCKPVSIIESSFSVKSGMSDTVGPGILEVAKDMQVDRAFGVTIVQQVPMAGHAGRSVTRPVLSRSPAGMRRDRYRKPGWLPYIKFVHFIRGKIQSPCRLSEPRHFYLPSPIEYDATATLVSSTTDELAAPPFGPRRLLHSFFLHWTDPSRQQTYYYTRESHRFPILRLPIFATPC